MVKRDIFLSRYITCPACNAQSTMEYPNPRLYVASNRESDMHVNSYRWADGAETNVLPHYFAIWQCPNCMFAELSDILTNPQGNGRDLKLLEAHKDIDMQGKLLLATLRKMIPASVREIDFEGALASHLSSLYLNFLLNKENRNHNKIGRIALRIAWLYREQQGEHSEEKSESNLLESLKERSSSFEGHLRTISDLITEFQDLSNRRASEIVLPGDEEDEEGNPYETVIASMGDKLSEIRTLHVMLQRTIMSDSQGEISTETASDHLEKHDINNKLIELKKKWPDLPVGEDQALRIAIFAFDYSYNNEDFYQSMEQSMSVVALIVDLYCRIGEHEKALSYVAEIYRRGMKSKQDLQSRMQYARKHDKLTPHDERMLKRKIGNINIAIRQAGETRRKILNLVIDRKKKVIDQVLSETENSSSKEQEQALLNADITTEIVKELRIRKMIKDDKKKGMFGFR